MTQGRIVRLRKETFAPGETRGGEFAGIHMVSADVRATLPARGCIVGDVYMPLLRAGVVLREYPAANLVDVGTPAGYLDANLRVARPQRSARVRRAGGSGGVGRHPRSDNRGMRSPHRRPWSPRRVCRLAGHDCPCAGCRHDLRVFTRRRRGDHPHARRGSRARDMTPCTCCPCTRGRRPWEGRSCTLRARTSTRCPSSDRCPTCWEPR